MKERPILFKGAMVRAILDGTKTQTRRIVKPIPDPRLTAVRTLKNTAGDVGALFTEHGGDLVGQRVSSAWSRHGNPGDRLWVKETHAYFDADPEHAGVVYRESDNGRTWEAEDEGWKWKPSLFMPRKWSRITLEVVSVRVERLSAISEEDAWAEGIQVKFCEAGKPCTCESNPVGEYADLWESINGPGSWALNPWVWVIEFKRMEP